MEASEATELELLNYWNDSSAYTKIVLGHGQPDSILHKVARTLRLEYYTEYWNIDAIFYEKRDEDYQGEKLYAEYLTIVLEHENKAGDASEEVYKLSTYNSPLKVLITYPAKNNHKEYLDKYSKILTKSDVFGDFATKRKHLMIFGYNNKNQILWPGYLWNGQEFDEINK